MILGAKDNQRESNSRLISLKKHQNLSTNKDFITKNSKIALNLPIPPNDYSWNLSYQLWKWCLHRANICDFSVLGVAFPLLPLEGKCQNKIFKFYREAHSIMRILGVLELIFSFKTIPERNYNHIKDNI